MDAAHQTTDGRQPMPDPSSIRRILVTAYGHIADVLPAGPALRALRETYPRARITVLGIPYTRELLAACPYVDDVMMMHEFKRWNSYWGQIERLWQFAMLTPRLYRRFDMVVVLHRRSRFLLCLGWLIRARVRAGLSDAAVPHWTTHPVHPRDGSPWYKDVNGQVLEAIGITTMHNGLELWTTPHDEQVIETFLAEQHHAPNDVLIGLHPGSHWTCQQWSPQRWATIADHLVSRYGARLVFTGTRDDHELVATIINAMTVKDTNPIDATGRTNILQFAALIKRMDLLICVNSAAPKIALAVGTPTLNLVGYENLVWTKPDPKDPVTIIRACDESNTIADWCPYHIWGNVVQCHRAECMGIGGLSLITTQMVERQIERRLKARPRAQVNNASRN